MKKITSLLMIAGIAGFASAAYNNATTTAAGNLSTNANWTTAPSAPTTKDTLFIKHAMYWNANVNWASASIDVIIIQAGGSIGPDGNNNVLTFPEGVTIYVELGGNITNVSGNNSNHAISIGSICIWGKKCCAGNEPIAGPIMMNNANPCGFVVLPLNVTGAKVIYNQNRVEFSWQVVQEEQVEYYRIEKSADGINFSVAGTVAAKGGNESHSYQFNDVNPLSTPVAYYRLVAVSSNQNEISSGLFAVKQQGKVEIAPAGNYLQINPKNVDGEYQYLVTDIQGRVISQGTGEGSTLIDLSTIATGSVYIVKIQSGDTYQSVKFIKA